jgi:hypothetical protein
LIDGVQKFALDIISWHFHWILLRTTVSVFGMQHLVLVIAAYCKFEQCRAILQAFEGKLIRIHPFSFLRNSKIYYYNRKFYNQKTH